MVDCGHGLNRSTTIAESRSFLSGTIGVFVIICGHSG